MRITSGYLLVSWPVQALVDNIQSSFQEFMMKYNKVYDSLEDYKIALNAFAENIKEMEELKANSDIEHEVGLNEYFDMPKEVFKQTMPCRAAPPISNSSKPARFQVRHLFSDPPPSIDWQAAGALGPVRKQSTFFNKCGCCYAMASTVVLESRFKLQAKIPQVIPLSVQQIVDCSGDWGNNGCNGGTEANSYEYVESEGMVKASIYSFNAKAGKCKTSLVAEPKNQCLKEGDLIYVATVPKGDEASLMSAVATGPVAVGVNADSPGFSNYKSGIITAKTCGQGKVTHAVTIVGYGTSKDGIPYWKIMNSWGTSWGMKGFAYIERAGVSAPGGATMFLRNYDYDPNSSQFTQGHLTFPCVPLRRIHTSGACSIMSEEHRYPVLRPTLTKC